MPPWQFYIEQFTSLPKSPEGDLLKGKNVIITGANTGLGFEVAQKFAKMSPNKLIITSRNMKAGAEALEKILKGAPRANVDVWELDLNKFSSIEAFTARAQKELGSLDLFLNNAGVNLGPELKPAQMTEDGHELSFQTNALAPTLLFFSLLPLLRKSPAPRVVWTTSEVHSWAPLEPIFEFGENPQPLIKSMDEQSPLVGFPRYMHSKLFAQMAIRNLIQACPDVKLIAVNPGLCASNFGRHFHTGGFSLSGMIRGLSMAPLMRSPEVGSRNLIHASVGDFDSCEYFTCCEPSYAPSSFFTQGKGMAITKRCWRELREEMERLRPGCTKDMKTVYAE